MPRYNENCFVGENVMMNEKVPCPECNKLLWVGVPDQYYLHSVGTKRDNNATSKQRCPHCEVYFYSWCAKKK